MSASEAKAAIFGYRCDVAEGPSTDIEMRAFEFREGIGSYKAAIHYSAWKPDIEMRQHEAANT